jgi:hypothetical protein
VSMYVSVFVCLSVFGQEFFQACSVLIRLSKRHVRMRWQSNKLCCTVNVRCGSWSAFEGAAAFWSSRVHIKEDEENMPFVHSVSLCVRAYVRVYVCMCVCVRVCVCGYVCVRMCVNLN